MRIDVIVIGAGAAGLAAATELSRNGVNVAVLEARGRLGGRVFTQRLPGSKLPVELGADFIHGEAPEIFALIQKGNLDVYYSGGEDWYFRDGKLTRSGDFWNDVEAINRKLGEHRGADISFAQFMQQRCGEIKPEACEMAKAFVEGFHAARTERVSVESLRESEEAADVINGEKQFRVRSGYESILVVLADELRQRNVPVHLNTAVQEVRWTTGKVIVIARSGSTVQQFQAGKALITLPLGVLKAKPGTPGGVRFTPELKAKARALAQLEMGAVVKLVLNFREPFWRNARAEGTTLSDLGFLHTLGESFPTWWTTAPAESSLLTGWTGGPNAERLSALPDEEIVEAGLRTVTKAFSMERDKIAAMLLSHHLHTWQKDPFSLGAYSYVGVGGLRAPDELAQPLHGTLFFAGEATSGGGHFGTVHGALKSGYRAAAEMLRK
ncbi:MAG TPA: NAD(P)/FAD-dependent oxidoreductase [Planctomycetota bacterium]|nr:NAD(P)/FAD-dependent oxidoreductase [Planctomycetota bacterium]